jgi:hypothetical protein
MNWSIGRHLSYANVAATLALVFAMSGGALAAKHYLINSTGQINPKVLKKLRGRTGSRGRLGKVGPPGPSGLSGPSGAIGGSKAFNTNSGEGILAFPAVAEQKLTVASLGLPAGSFSVYGKLIADNHDTTKRPIVRCELLLAGAVIDPGYSGLSLGSGGSEPEASGHYLVLAGTGSLSGPGTAEIACKVSDTVGIYLDRSITAIQVGSLG